MVATTFAIALTSELLIFLGSPALGIHPRVLASKALSSGVSVTSLPGRPYHMTGQDELAKVKPPAIKDWIVFEELAVIRPWSFALRQHSLLLRFRLVAVPIPQCFYMVSIATGLIGVTT